MIFDTFKIVGVIGLISIIFGTYLISIKKKKKEKIYFFLLIGGICLLLYSIKINDLIFIIMQAIYILTIIYNFIKLKK